MTYEGAESSVFCLANVSIFLFAWMLYRRFSDFGATGRRTARVRYFTHHKPVCALVCAASVGNLVRGNLHEWHDHVVSRIIWESLHITYTFSLLLGSCGALGAFYSGLPRIKGGGIEQYDESAMATETIVVSLIASYLVSVVLMGCGILTNVDWCLVGATCCVICVAAFVAWMIASATRSASSRIACMIDHLQSVSPAHFANTNAIGGRPGSTRDRLLSSSQLLRATQRKVERSACAIVTVFLFVIACLILKAVQYKMRLGLLRGLLANETARYAPMWFVWMQLGCACILLASVRPTSAHVAQAPSPAPPKKLLDVPGDHKDRTCSRGTTEHIAPHFPKAPSDQAWKDAASCVVEYGVRPRTTSFAS